MFMKSPEVGPTERNFIFVSQKNVVVVRDRLSVLLWIINTVYRDNADSEMLDLHKRIMLQNGRNG